MNTYVKVSRSGEILGRKQLADKPPAPGHLHKQKPYYLPETVEEKPDCNRVIETLTREEVVMKRKVRVKWTISPKPLAEVVADLTDRVDSDAEIQRQRHGTTRPGQQAEYHQVRQEAVQYRRNPSQGPFPFLQASVDAGEAVTLGEAAGLVLSAHSLWQDKGAQIRRARKIAKKAIRAAKTVKAAWEAYQSITWPD